MSNKDDFRKLTSLASIYRPHQLKTKAAAYLKALLIQHDCIMIDAAMAMEHDQGSNIAPFMAMHGDRRTLEIVLQILEQVDTDFERASPSTVEAYIKTQLENISGAETELDELRAHYENLFNESQDLRE